MDEVVSVSEFIKNINKTIQPFSQITVEGEVSDFDPSSRGKWIGFDLKDEDTEQVLNCFTTGSKFRSWGMEEVLEEGMKVQVQGQVKIRKRGNFSMFMKELTLAGEGTLKKAYEKLKKKLKREGLFSDERKRSIPEFPQKIGLITSKDARAYSDFLKGLKERIGGLKIHHYNVHVQGKNAIPEITSAFEYFDQNNLGLDLIVLLRGGGSLEDLQAFNSEQVARAVFSSSKPVVCGVGHEKDVTLAGLSCDLRASTPSNAAELIVPSREQIKSELDSLVYKMRTSFELLVDDNYKVIDKFLNVGRSFYQNKIQALENILLKFSQSFKNYKNRIERYRDQIERSETEIKRAVKLKIDNLDKFIKEKKRLLKSFSPREVLKRGYSIVEKEGKIIKDASKLDVDELVSVKLHKGGFKSLIKKIKE